MIFDVVIIDNDGRSIFSCDGIDREVFNEFFIQNCKINIHGGFEMNIFDYKHAINLLWERTAS